ncbi:MAG: sulfite exporter TauE/SafE family protein [Candidatus Lambdaproteobacteria bacterium]|nr:sulfite exporter TauE/SafE family protein [Candidatus Lambdaproteobacteria bacterium]
MFATSAISAMVGFGGGAMLIAVVLLFMPPGSAIPFHGMLQLVANSSRVVLLRRWVAWPLAVPYLVLLPLGAVLGRWLFGGISERAIFVLIGLFVLATLVSREVPFLKGREYPRWFFLLLGLGVGILGSTVGVVGVLVAPFLDRRDLTKEGINGTMAVMTAAMHLMKIAAFTAFGFDVVAHLPLMLLLAPAVILGSYFGKSILVRFSERAFRLLFKGTLAALALKLMLWDGLLKALL